MAQLRQATPKPPEAWSFALSISCHLMSTSKRERIGGRLNCIDGNTNRIPLQHGKIEQESARVEGLESAGMGPHKKHNKGNRSRQARQLIEDQYVGAF